jgi:hypothetical protein
MQSEDKGFDKDVMGDRKESGLVHTPVACWNPTWQQTCSWRVKAFDILQHSVFLRLACSIARVRALQKH